MVGLVLEMLSYVTVYKWWGWFWRFFPAHPLLLASVTTHHPQTKGTLTPATSVFACLCSPRWRTSHQLCHRWAPQYSVDFGGDCSFDAVQVTSALLYGWHVLWSLLACLGSLEGSQFAEYPSTQPSLTTVPEQWSSLTSWSRGKWKPSVTASALTGADFFLPTTGVGNGLPFTLHNLSGHIVGVHCSLGTTLRRRNESFST